MSEITSFVDIFAILVQLTSVIISFALKSQVFAGELSKTDIIFTQSSFFSKTAQIHSKSPFKEVIKSSFSFLLKYSV
jgi:hypothetical protein